MALPCVRALADDSGDEEAWQLKFQATGIYQYKPAFSALYSGTNSLLPPRAESRSVTATIFAGARVWSGGEVYFNPEMALGVPFSDLKGLGGFTNGEMARTSGPDPSFYRARLFLRQTWGLGGGSEHLASAPNQMAGWVDADRVVLTAGNVSALDIFDINKYSGDPRTSNFNWSLMAAGAWDYPADARGYTWGAALEYLTSEWALRAGRFMQPKESNGLPLNPSIFQSYGDVVEYEHGYTLAGQPGRVRVLGFHNRADMGSYNAAIDLAAAQGGTPSLAATRTQYRNKYGLALNVEHDLSADVGLWGRASWNNGQTETFAFTEIDQSLTGGTAVKGTRWQRPDDEVGLAFAVNGISSAHRNYLALGGLGFFLGDGALSYANERIAETYYSVKAVRGLWFTLDYQHVQNPAYNTARGPANFYGVRAHVEF
jgi:hypothetical protein